MHGSKLELSSNLPQLLRDDETLDACLTNLFKSEVSDIFPDASDRESSICLLMNHELHCL